MEVALKQEDEKGLSPSIKYINIVHRVQFNEIPPHVEYSLSKKGEKIEKVFNELSKWGLEIMKVDTNI